ncbi:MAG: alpha-amylase family glycosyl hydrolase, partial [Myxococcota bacterium]|nr:alpha-amylase family glycosyl hydrolase [Myxococcota bacterium]
MSSHTHHWWQQGIVYQVYPRSFRDTNGDGIGDLPGIVEKLDYLSWLGVEALWVSPIYPSPMADFGYDVSDYCDVDGIFGTLSDVDDLVREAHARNLKVILDFVPNHTSSRHPWFIESRASRENPKRDFYIWRDAKDDGSPPNNWLSVFGGSAWEWDETTRQYYYHAFLKEQPDLNWRNPQVRQQMYSAMAFWLDRGIDGFRVDVLWHLIKDAALRDNPPNPDYQPGPGHAPYNALSPAYSTDQPEVHDIVAEMRALTDRYSERVLIGEIYLPIQKLVAYYGRDGRGAHLPFNFQLITLPWEARRIDAAISEYEGAMPDHGWPNWVLGNHDQPRIASRVGLAQARVAAMMLLTLRGTPTLYYGDELGMRDGVISSEEVQDPQEKNLPGLGLNRDPARTPMQWDANPGAGFSSGRPWLPLSSDSPRVNVELQRRDPDSMLSFYRRLITLRRHENALSVGSYTPLAVEGDLLAYKR